MAIGILWLLRRKRPDRGREKSQYQACGLTGWSGFLVLLAALSGCVQQDARVGAILDFVSPGVAYNPRGFSPLRETPELSEKPIIEDLRLLREIGFVSLVTYAANGILGSVPALARREGFSGTIIMGIWDPSSQEELRMAVAQAPFVDGYCLGNEGLGVRYGRDHLALRMDELRSRTGRPVTTSEPIDSYLAGPNRGWLMQHSDWIFPLAHPFWATKVDPDEAVHWILVRYDLLASTTRRPVILKEAGVPAGGKVGFNEQAQIGFFLPSTNPGYRSSTLRRSTSLGSLTSYDTMKPRPIGDSTVTTVAQRR